jgi:lipoprotein-anchoring transpeptidase ErfK/SrfK
VFLVVVLAATVAGGAATALDLALSASPSTSGHHNVAVKRQVARHTTVPAAQAGPLITIPPAPSTTAPPSDPTGQSDATALATGGKSYVVPAVPAVLNSSPSNITDPSVVATAVVRTLPLYSAPGASKPSRTLANPNYLGAPLVLLVTGFQAGWVQAYIPVRPNETTAWMPAADVAISWVPDHIVISLHARQLTLYHDNVSVFQTSVAPGAPSSPTPTGSFFVAFIVKLTDPTNVYGPYAMGTSAFSNTYYSFDGGPGQVGIHGTNQPWVIGSYASHGCVRLNNNAITTLAQQVLPGTPVEIEP